MPINAPAEQTLKIFLAQQNYLIGDFEGNTAKIISSVREARSAGGDLIVFSELSVCGYPPRDFLEFDDFIERSLQAIEQIREEADTIGVLVGAPSRNPVKEGKDLFNSAYLLHEKEVKGVAHKSLLPTYDIFDEYRYFEPAFTHATLPFRGLRLAVTVCEDIWNLHDNPLYRICPMDELMREQPHLMVNLSASPFDYAHKAGRQHIVKRNVARYSLPMIYVNAVGAQTEMVFDGGSLAMDQHQNIALEMPYFEEGLASVTLRLPDEAFEEGVQKGALNIPTVQELPKELQAEESIEEIHRALILGIRDYFRKMGFGKSVVASSGGIDSAVVLALAAEALGADAVHAVGMPSQFSSEGSVTDAGQLAKNLGVRHDTLPIKDIFDTYETALAPLFGDLPFNIAEENIQSRIRGTLVMALANKFGYILLNTSNKSELACGYGTLYGDMAGGLGVLGDLYKLQVFALARHLNRTREIIPQAILTKPPSAELRPGQKDSDSLPPYETLDPILYQYIERRQGPRDLARSGHDEVLVARILKLVNIAEYKRAQFCPVIRISPKAFGVGRRLPIVGKYLG